MENIKFSVFDIFAYLLPGALVLSTIVLFATPAISDISEYVAMVQSLSLGAALVFVFVSYIIGNVIDNLGSWLYYKVGCRIWGGSYLKNQHPTLSHAQQRALIREYSPENFIFLHTWKVLKAMSHNLSFAVLVLALASFIRYTQYQIAQWLIITIVSIISAIVLLNRANVYDRWHYKELLETIDVLRLEEKVKSVSSNNHKSVKRVKNA